jgi:hypothetical protein
VISWIITGILALAIIRIVWVEVKCGRRFKGTLANTNEQIEEIKRSATANYRAKFGRDPTGTFEIVDMPQAASKKS